MAARDLPDAEGTIAGYAVRRCLRTVHDEAPLRTFLAADVKNLRRIRRVVLRVRSHVGRTGPEDFERLAVRLAPALELHHPNVARELDVQVVRVEHPSWARTTGPREHVHHVLASEYRPEPSLDRIIPIGPMEPLRASRILRQMLLACEAAHRRALIHRLLSPAKIHLTMSTAGPGDHVRVRDFGLALFLGAQGKGRGLLGTAVLAYAPPEVLVAGPCDQRADLYAAGAIAYALLAGAPPFRGDSRRERLRAILSETPAPLPRRIRSTLPPGLEDLVMGLLAREPNDRPRDARAAIAALDGVVGPS